MKSVNTSPISGMQELLPASQATFNQLKNEIARVYYLHGFQSIETPTIDRMEILLAKAGGDTEKQIYKVIKTEETVNDADQALRFDHTVPLARYIVEHESNLAFPFKVCQIGRNFRGERAQKGRFREFYQCDVDIIGRGELAVAYDAEVITTLFDTLKVFSLPKYTLRISNRKILSGLLADLNLQDVAEQVFSIIDHAEKVPKEKTLQNLQDLNLTESSTAKIVEFMETRGSRVEVTTKLAKMSENSLFQQGVAELNTVLGLVEKSVPKDNLVADMLIVRGLDYYTGTVFECFLDGYKQIGSICSGGRYENLTKYYSEQAFPGVGGSIGLTRLFYVLNEYDLLKSQMEKPIDIVIIPLSEQEYAPAVTLAQTLRSQAFSVDVVFTNKKIGDQLNYAGKIGRFAVIIGEEEAKSGNYQIKNLETREQVPLADFLETA